MLDNGKNKIRVFLYGSLFTAIILGVHAQDIAYFTHRSLAIPLMVGISTSTILSIFLFLSPPILASKFNEYNRMLKKEFNIYLGINILAGIIVSAFSIIVLIAWCG